jgi:hypothetical protein
MLGHQSIEPIIGRLLPLASHAWNCVASIDGRCQLRAGRLSAANRQIIAADDPGTVRHRPSKPLPPSRR